jgi:hypothetical protein
MPGRPGHLCAPRGCSDLIVVIAGEGRAAHRALAHPVVAGGGGVDTSAVAGGDEAPCHGKPDGAPEAARVVGITSTQVVQRAGRLLGDHHADHLAMGRTALGGEGRSAPLGRVSGEDGDAVGGDVDVPAMDGLARARRVAVQRRLHLSSCFSLQVTIRGSAPAWRTRPASAGAVMPTMSPPLSTSSQAPPKASASSWRSERSLCRKRVRARLTCRRLQVVCARGAQGSTPWTLFGNASVWAEVPLQV